MTKHEFIELLKRVNPELYFHRELALPEATKMTAVHCFMNKIDNDDTDEIRHQLFSLSNIGVFDFK